MNSDPRSPAATKKTSVSCRRHSQTSNNESPTTTGNKKIKYNMDLNSFLDQLAMDSSSRGFKILEVAGEETRLLSKSLREEESNDTHLR